MLVARVVVTSLEWRRETKPKGTLQKEMMSFCNRFNMRHEGKERPNDETRVASGKKDGNEINGEEEHLISLILQMLIAGILELTWECC